MSRISREELWMALATLVSERSSCSRAKVGSIIIDQRNRVISMGYNGAPARQDHCLGIGCLVDELGHCRRTIHAEINAIINAQASVDGCWMYSTHEPCLECLKVCITAGIDYIYFIENYIPPASDLRVTQDFRSDNGIVIEREVGEKYFRVCL